MRDNGCPRDPRVAFAQGWDERDCPFTSAPEAQYWKACWNMANAEAYMEHVYGSSGNVRARLIEVGILPAPEPDAPVPF